MEEVVWGREGGREREGGGWGNQFKKEKRKGVENGGSIPVVLGSGMGVITRGMNPETESSRRQNMTRSALQPAWCVRGSASGPAWCETWGTALEVLITNRKTLAFHAVSRRLPLKYWLSLRGSQEGFSFLVIENLCYSICGITLSSFFPSARPLSLCFWPSLSPCIFLFLPQSN